MSECFLEDKFATVLHDFALFLMDLKFKNLNCLKLKYHNVNDNV